MFKLGSTINKSELESDFFEIVQLLPTSISELVDLNKLIGHEDAWGIDRFDLIFSHELPVFGAIHQNQIVGYIVYLACLDEARILSLLVHPKFRYRGIAGKLLLHVFTDARSKQLRYVLLDVRISNLTAINLYTKLGFKILDTRLDYYNHTLPAESAYFMQVCL